MERYSRLPYLHRTLFVQPAGGEPGDGLDYQPEGAHDVWGTHPGIFLLSQQGMERVRAHSVRHLRPLAGDGTEV